MENFDSVYTIELNGTKGWEVISCFTSLNTAINSFRNYLLNDPGQYRLTSTKLVEENPTEDFEAMTGEAPEYSVRVDGWADVPGISDSTSFRESSIGRSGSDW